MKVEPQLQKVNEGDCLNPKTITGDQARLDVSARGVWTPFDKTFLDIRVSHPNCLSNRTKTLKAGMAPQGGCGGCAPPPDKIPKINFRAILR